MIKGGLAVSLWCLVWELSDGQRGRLMPPTPAIKTWCCSGSCSSATASMTPKYVLEGLMVSQLE